MHPLDWASLVTVLAASTTGSFLLLRRGSAMSTLALAVVMLSGSVWAVMGLLAEQAAEGSAVAMLNRGIVVLAAVQATSAFWFCLTLAGHRPTGRRARALLVQPALVVLAAATDPWTGLVIAGASVGESVSLAFGPVFWLHTGYCYLLLVGGAVALLRAATWAVPGHRLHYLMAVIAMSPPVLGNVVSTLGAGAGQRDLTAPLFLVTALLWLWVDRVSVRFRSAPITTAQVLRALTDGVMVVDATGRLVDANPAALCLLLGRDGSALADLVGKHWRDVADAGLAGAVDAMSGGEGSRTLVRPDGSVVDLRITAVGEPGRAAGWVVVARDVTLVERLRAELAEQAVRDGLTGLHNRRHLERVLAAAVTQQDVLSVAVVDIDHFKGVNDRFGHLVGDRVLVAVAAALRAGVRVEDAVARLGGEEFVLVLPGLDAAAALVRVEEARRSCADVQVPVPGGRAGVTVSAGLAQHRPGQDTEALLAAADAALYAAKAAGRDRVVVAGAVPSPR